MILKALLAILIIVAAILALAATRPNTFHIERSTVINSPAGKIFPLINDFHNWKRWAPDEKGNAAVTRIYSGAESGVGAISDWEGPGNAGKGRMQIVESSPWNKLVVQVDWARPFSARNINQFTLEPNGSATKLTWSMTGPNLFVMKLMSIFVNLDRNMGRHFEDGLQNLKAAAEQ